MLLLYSEQHLKISPLLQVLHVQVEDPQREFLQAWLDLHNRDK